MIATKSYVPLLALLGCGSPTPRTASNVERPSPAGPSAPLIDAARDVFDACRGHGDLHAVLADADRQLQVAFNCVDKSVGVPGMFMNRERVLAELSHVKITDEPPTCDESRRCCRFVRDAGAPRDEATVSEACFDENGQLERLVIIEQDACFG